jgi:hypothetical protein
MISKVLATMKLGMQSDYVNGRIDVLKKAGKSINAGAISAEATEAIANNARRFAGKTILSGVRAEYQDQFKKNLVIYRKSKHLEEDFLNSVAQRAFRLGSTQSS